MQSSPSTTLSCGRYLTALLRAELWGEQPPEKPEDVSFEELYWLAKRHGLETMSYDAVSKLKMLPEDDLLSHWRSSRDANTAKNMVQRAHRDRILQELSRRGIDVLPLKGSLLIEMYPRPDQRQMSDLDILIRKEQREQVRQGMVDLGYQVDRFEVTNEDTYSQKPFMHIEMHHQLFDAMSPFYQLRSYYADPWARSISDEGAQHRYHFSWEDFYIYFLAHFYKHFYSGGSGIRNVMDIHVFLRQYGETLDENYIRGELDSIGLSEFRMKMERLANQWFGQLETVDSTVEEEIEETIFTSGAYGMKINSRSHNIQHLEEQYSSVLIGKAAYLFRLLFPSYERIIVQFPQFKGKKKILPLLWVYRICDRILFNRERITGNIKAIREYKPTTDGKEGDA